MNPFDLFYFIVGNKFLIIDTNVCNEVIETSEAKVTNKNILFKFIAILAFLV